VLRTYVFWVDRDKKRLKKIQKLTLKLGFKNVALLKDSYRQFFCLSPIVYITVIFISIVLTAILTPVLLQ
jgi:hypothetical protein